MAGLVGYVHSRIITQYGRGGFFFFPVDLGLVTLKTKNTRTSESLKKENKCVTLGGEMICICEHFFKEKCGMPLAGWH